MDEVRPRAGNFVVDGVSGGDTALPTRGGQALSEEAEGVGDAVCVEGLVFTILVVEAGLVATLDDMDEH